MPLKAEAPELRIALAAMIGAASATAVKGRCAEQLDDAAVLIAEVSAATIRNAGGLEPPLKVRLEATRLIASFCANCGACPRGRGLTGAYADGERDAA